MLPYVKRPHAAGVGIHLPDGPTAPRKNKRKKIKESKRKTWNQDIVLVWGFTEVRSKPVNVKAFVYDSLLEPDGTIWKHLRNAVRALLISFMLAILSISQDVSILINLVVMRGSLGILSDIIIYDTFLFLSPHLLVVGLKLQIHNSMSLPKTSCPGVAFRVMWWLHLIA